MINFILNLTFQNQTFKYKISVVNFCIWPSAKSTFFAANKKQHTVYTSDDHLLLTSVFHELGRYFI